MTLPILPMELINKILVMRPSHPVAKLLKQPIDKYNNYVNHFQKYCCENYDLDLKFIKIVKIINLIIYV
jgi:hypothetical protein